ncbi:hypothetical protein YASMINEVIRUS_1386 [Yasminevirus sp. GU-2018]|uniref:Uncharacterized protein n=1 Tax=Yasminevirus sp. GU-2018 TaxID=2420051 RepID=A0A5K0UBG2_9VIRU|nr:hypothetical protein YASMINEVIRUS_1386 [Yasminevirus sp. GU-2018]
MKEHMSTQMKTQTPTQIFAGRSIDYSTKDFDGWHELVMLTPLEGSQLFDVSLDTSLFDSIALWMTLDTFRSTLISNPVSISASNPTPTPDGVSGSNHGNDSDTPYDYFRPNTKWDTEKILGLISTNNKSDSHRNDHGHDDRSHDDRSHHIRHDAKKRVEDLYSNCFRKGTFVSDPEIIRMIAEVCRKLNLHIFVYNVEPVYDTSVRFDTVSIGKVMLEVRPRPSFDKTITSYGAISNPRKVAIAYNPRAGCYRRYSLIASGIPSVPIVKLDTVYTIATKSCMCVGVNRYYVDTYKELRTLAEKVAEFVLKDMIDPEKSPGSLHSPVLNSTVKEKEVSRMSGQNSPDLVTNEQNPPLQNHKNRSTEICTVIVDQINAIREKVANRTREVDDLFEQYEMVRAEHAKERDRFLHGSVHLSDEAKETLEQHVKKLSTTIDHFASVIKRKKVAITIEEDTITVLIQRIEAFQNSPQQSHDSAGQKILGQKGPEHKNPNHVYHDLQADVESVSTSTSNLPKDPSRTQIYQIPRWRTNYAKNHIRVNTLQDRPYDRAGDKPSDGSQDRTHDRLGDKQQNTHYRTQQISYQPRHQNSHTYSSFHNHHSGHHSSYQIKQPSLKERRF